MTSDNKYDSRLEEGLLPVATDEKRCSTIPTTSKEPTKKMAGPRRVLFAVVVCGLMTLSLASVIGHRGMPCARGQQSDAQAVVSEGDLKDPAKVDILHRLLHAYFPERYQDGVYASDQDAIAAVEADDADLASALVQLAKRQDNTTASATQSSQAPPTSEATTPSTQPPVSTPTPTATPTPTPSEPSTSAPQPDTTTTPPTPTTTSTPEQPTTPQTTSQPPQTTPTTSATSAAPTSDDDSWVPFFFFFSPSPFFYPLFCSHYGLPRVFECVRVGYVYLPFSPDYYGRDILVPYNVEYACVVCVVGVVGVVCIQNTRQSSTSTSSRRTTTSFSQVRATITSTASNGDVVLVTATSFVAVPPEPEPTSSAGGGGGGGGLQNGAVPVGSVSFGLPVTLAAAVAGAMLLL
ncbi:uncharacterized protein CTRU02_201602 [Colletotrichum truncatum]|uniref:Uncharacterized protein n=1 Tax=Colletotrichum truncatum TaxID=5467 RepID=A0ACC3ZHV9_COLTU